MFFLALTFLITFAENWGLVHLKQRLSAARGRIWSEKSWINIIYVEEIKKGFADAIKPTFMRLKFPFIVSDW